MTTYTAQLGLQEALLATDRCPGCSTGRLVVETCGDEPQFRCRQCGTVWRVVLGRASRVTPHSG